MRIIGAMENQDFAFYFLGIFRIGRIQSAMKAHDSFEICAAPGQLKNRHSAEAAAHSRDTRYVCPRIGCKNP